MQTIDTKYGTNIPAYLGPHMYKHWKEVLDDGESRIMEFNGVKILIYKDKP